MEFPGFWELATLAVLALLIFGPERLPKMARDAGRMIARFKAEASATLQELKDAAELEELTTVRDDLKSTAADLRSAGRDLQSAGREVRDGLDVHSETRARGAVGAGAAAPAAGAGRQGPPPPPPFDPDTP